jgi:hypothetical protein
MREKLTPDDVSGNAAALRILTAERKDLAPANARSAQWKIVLVFAEFPDKDYIVNATSYKTLAAYLGDDETKWPGEWIVMAPTTTTFEGKSYEKIHVASPERWDKVMKATAKKRAAAQ